MAEDKIEMTDDNGAVAPNPADNPRNKLFNEIAEAEADAKPDIVDVADDDHGRLTDVEPRTEVGEEEKPEAAAQPAKRKIKANGQEREVTEEELIKLAEKGAGADELFRDAARLRKEAEELRRQQQPAATAVDDDDRALARALQMGNEEEAAAVIRKIRTRPSEPADVQNLIDQRLEFRNSADWFQKEYPDIVSDPNLLQLVLGEDEKLVNAGDKRGYKDRYKQIGDGLRKWRDGLKAPASTQERIERKANLQLVPAASVRAAAPKEEDDGPSDREFIAQEARRRGQGYPK